MATHNQNIRRMMTGGITDGFKTPMPVLRWNVGSITDKFLCSPGVTWHGIFVGQFVKHPTENKYAMDTAATQYVDSSTQNTQGAIPTDAEYVVDIVRCVILHQTDTGSNVYEYREEDQTRPYSEMAYNGDPFSAYWYNATYYAYPTWEYPANWSEEHIEERRVIRNNLVRYLVLCTPFPYTAPAITAFTILEPTLERNYYYGGKYYDRPVVECLYDSANDAWYQPDGTTELDYPSANSYLYDTTNDAWYAYTVGSGWDNTGVTPTELDYNLTDVLGVSAHLLVGSGSTSINKDATPSYINGMMVQSYVSLPSASNFTIGRVSGHGKLKVVVLAESSGNALLKWDKFNSATTTQEQTVTTSFNSASGNIQTITFDLTSAGLVYTDLRVSFNTTVKVYAITWEPDSYFWNFSSLNKTSYKNITLTSNGKNLFSNSGTASNRRLVYSQFAFNYRYLTYLSAAKGDYFQIGPLSATKGILNIYAPFEQNNNVITVTNTSTGKLWRSATIEKTGSTPILVSIPIDEELDNASLKITMENASLGHTYFLAFEFIPE